MQPASAPSHEAPQYSIHRESLKVLAVFLAAYMLFWGGHYTTGDGARKIAWAKAIAFGPSAATRGPNGLYSKYGIGHTLIALPAVTTAAFIQRNTGIKCEAALYTFIFVANGALLVSLVAFYLLHFYPPSRVWPTAALIGFATAWWPYTKLDFSEPLIASILFAGFVMMRFGREWLGFAVAAFAIAVRSDAIILVSLLGIWWLIQRPTVSAALKIMLAGLPSVALTMAANYVRYHSLFDHGYAGETFSTPFLVGLHGLFFSAGKSVFLFSPPLALGFIGWRKFRQSAGRLDAFLFLAIFAAEVILYSTWWDWSSDDAWGVRFLIPGVVLMCIPAVAALQRRALVVALAAIGVSVQLLAVLAGSLDYVLLVHSQLPQRKAVYVQGENRLDFDDVRFNPRYSQIAANLIFIRELLHVPPHPSPPAVTATDDTPLYDTLSPDVWARAAHWDVFWLNLGKSRR